jgi:hypothetical protein
MIKGLLQTAVTVLVVLMVVKFIKPKLPTSIAQFLP